MGPVRKSRAKGVKEINMKNEPFRIGLDLDGVVADWCGTTMRFLNEFKGYTFDPTFEHPHWNWLEGQVKPEDWKWLWNEAIELESMFLDMRLFPGAFDFMEKLAEKGDIIVLTSRPKSARQDTLRWLHDHMAAPVAGVNFFKHGTDKHLVNVEVLIEDNIDNAWAYIDERPGANVILFDRLYNQSDLWGEFGGENRCKTYEEILAKVDSILQRR
jgi:5'(3')-deoxyribonucleotidase